MFQYPPKKYTAPNAFAPPESDLCASKCPASSCEIRLPTCQIFIFLHDILNSAGGLRGFLELADESCDQENVKKCTLNALQLCDSLIEEIEHYRSFLTGLQDYRSASKEEVKAHDILELTALKLKMHSVSKGRTIEVASDSADVSVVTDKTLLSYILVNLTKNAVEATKEGGTVLIGAAKKEYFVRFFVHNEGVIPDDVQERIFDKNFSTKGASRGIGLFSARMLGEKLGAHVHFESTKEGGTYFYIDLPPVL